jgi:hypothetical protein
MSPKVTFQQVAEDSSGISKVRVVVHTMGPVGPNTSNNHWLIYLLLREGGGSVRVNMRAVSDSDNRGLIEYEKQEYTLSNSALRSWDFDVIGDVCVKDIANHLHSKQMHRYDMSGGGSGRRYWV